ncbi:hypothetical protein CPB86DRAFT_774487 [Serendipita vermifera]|nr:hypothetical protein CPB86DRAFT_774487 [Serendipita vermifera]
MIPGEVTNVHPGVGVNKTIYTYLSQEQRYTKLVKLIDFDEEYVTILNTTTTNITFFAPDNKALTPPKSRRRGGHDSALSLVTLYEEYERLYANQNDNEEGGGGGDDDDEERKKRFKKILHALLQYHTLPDGLDRFGLDTNRTYATALEAKDGSFGGQARRISVGSGLTSHLLINEYVLSDWFFVTAENGYVFGVNHPILPPPSILDELFLTTDFSILTSALQKVGLDDELQWRWKKSSETEGDGPVVSLFAPNDFAFKRLPWRLRVFLFSPAGEKVLKKLLQFHIVPDYILHSDWLYNGTSDDELRRSQAAVDDGEDWYQDLNVGQGLPRQRRHKKMCKLRSKSKKQNKKCRNRKNYDGMSPFFAPLTSNDHWPTPNVTVNTTVPTLLKDHELSFVVVKPHRKHDHFTPTFLPLGQLLDDQHSEESNVVPFPFARSWVFANGVGTTGEYVARNGAVYSLNRLLHPRKPNNEDGNDSREDDRWDDWEEWLPAWGDE